MTGHSHLMNGERKLFIIKMIVAKAGFEANIIENHDQPRGASLFIPEEDYGFYSLSALATIIFCERGLPFLYQGQEIGMSNRQWKYDEFNDLETINQYQIALKAGMSKEQALEIARHHSRDNARTPMQWSSEEMQDFQKENRGCQLMRTIKW